MIVVAGENVVDLVPEPGGRYRPVLGGGPATVAVALARLGRPVSMAARLGADVFGPAARDRLTSAGVDPRYLVESPDPSTLAVVSLDGTGSARYDFWLAGAADFGWRPGELPAGLAGVSAVHLGSLAAFLPPGADLLERWAAEARRTATVTLDPNLRPAAIAAAYRSPGPDLPAAARDRLDRLVGLADVVKISDEDLAAGWPGEPGVELAGRWLAAPDGGPVLVVITRGAAGATGLTRSTRVDVPAVPVEPVDTIGAGDTAMGALLAELDRHALLGAPNRGRLAAVPGDTLAGILAPMCLAAALTCTRPGADPPTAAELAASRPRRGTGPAAQE